MIGAGFLSRRINLEIRTEHGPELSAPIGDFNMTVEKAEAGRRRADPDAALSGINHFANAAG